jgi:hypothetical protein
MERMVRVKRMVNPREHDAATGALKDVEAKMAKLTALWTQRLSRRHCSVDSRNWSSSDVPRLIELPVRTPI